MSSARADFSGSERRHCSSSTPRISVSTLRIRPSSSFIRSRGTLPAASQRSAMSRKAFLAASTSVTGSSASASTRSFSLTSALAANSASSAALAASRAPKNVSWAPRKRFHSSSSMSLRAGPAAFHCAHQVAVAARRRAPLGRVGELLGLLGQPLLDDPRALALLVLLGEVRLAASGVRRARGREAAPQRVVGGPVDARERLPLVEQLAQPVGAVAPVGALRRSSRPRRRASPSAPSTPPASCAFSTLRASRCSSMTGLSASRRADSAARSPTALASVTCPSTVLTDSFASSGDITPERTRCSSSSTSNARAA